MVTATRAAEVTVQFYSLWLEAGGVEVEEAAGFQAGDDPLVLRVKH